MAPTGLKQVVIVTDYDLLNKTKTKLPNGYVESLVLNSCHPNRVTKVNIISNRTSRNHAPCRRRLQKKAPVTSVVALSDTEPESHLETSDKLNRVTFLQNNWLVIFNNVNVVNVTGRLRTWLQNKDD